MPSLGLVFSAIAFLGWGFGDFLIQKSVRRVGIWWTMLMIGIIGTVFLSPFALDEFPRLFSQPKDFVFLLTSALISIGVAVVTFEAFRLGKMAVVSPILGLEIPTTIFLSFLIRPQPVTGPQLALASVIFMGVVLTGLEPKQGARRFRLEPGVLMGIFSGIGLGIMNVFLGISSQDLSPVLTNFVLNALITVAAIGVLLFARSTRPSFPITRSNYILLISMAFVDTSAWLGYTMATTLFPIAVAGAIGSGYIAIATLLGMFVSKEKTTERQRVGIVMTICAVILLASISSF